MPGTYRATIRAGGRVVSRSDWITLSAGEHVDLGEVRAARPGSLLVEVEMPAGASLGGMVLDENLENAEHLRASGSGLGVLELAPGEWILHLEVDGMADVFEPFTIRAGETTRVPVSLEPGVARTLVFRAADPARTWKRLEVSLRGAQGRLCCGRSLSRATASAESLLVLLPVGSFTVEAETDTGLGARGSFEVTSLATQDAPLVFELR